MKEFIYKFFEIYNFRFWLLIFEVSFIPFGMAIGGLIYQATHKEECDGEDQ